MRKITLEIGRSAFSYIIERNDKHIHDSIKEIRKIFSDNTGHVELEMIVYDGVKSLISSGRSKSNSFEEVERFVDVMNQNGIRFFLALNGGLSYSSLPWNLLDGEKNLLRFLHENGERHNLQNGVIIGNDGLLDYVGNEGLNLKRVASCLRILDYNRPTSYPDLFRDYDLVVPLNQHTSSSFLGQYVEYAEKMLLFLTLGCNENDLKKCHAHYLAYELNNRRNITGDIHCTVYGTPYILTGELDKRDVYVSPRGFDTAVPPFALDIGKKDCICYSANRLIDRDGELEYFISAGVNKFKIARSHEIWKADIVKLAKAVERVYSKSGFVESSAE